MQFYHAKGKLLYVFVILALLLSCKTQKTSFRHKDPIYYTFSSEVEELLVWFFDELDSLSLYDVYYKDNAVITLGCQAFESNAYYVGVYKLHRIDKKIEYYTPSYRPYTAIDSIKMKRKDFSDRPIPFVAPRTNRYASIKNGKYILPVMMNYDHTGLVGVTKVEHPLTGTVPAWGDFYILFNGDMKVTGFHYKGRSYDVLSEAEAEEEKEEK